MDKKFNGMTRKTKAGRTTKRTRNTVENRTDKGARSKTDRKTDGRTTNTDDNHGGKLKWWSDRKEQA